MKGTASRAVYVGDSAFMAGERHQAGEGSLLLVLNGYEKLTDVPEDQPYPIYNYAPYSTSYALQGVPAGSTVYLIEGIDWKKVTQIQGSAAVQKAEFAPGEMKM